MTGVSDDPQRQRRSTEDAQRSLGRYLSVVVPDYAVYMSPDETGGKRSSVVVRVLAGRSSVVTMHSAEITQPMAVYLYPPKGEDARAAGERALATQDWIERAFEQGVDPGRAMRVPMWDWSTTPRGEEMPEDWDRVIDYYRVEGFTASSQPDPDDGRRWSISSTLRLVWVRHPPLSSGPTVEGIGVRPDPDHPPR